MNRHETKDCPRCNKPFECKPGNITQCQCFGIKVKPELKAWLDKCYYDCLCRECLQYLQQDQNLFKENFLNR